MHLSILIESVPLNNQHMSIAVYEQGHLLGSVQEWAANTARIDIVVEPPFVLEMQVSGKDQFDTQVDEQGNIIADKCLKIKGLAVDGIWIKSWLLESRVIEFVDLNGNVRHTNYLGQNGVAKFHMPQDALEFWLDTLTEH